MASYNMSWGEFTGDSSFDYANLLLSLEYILVNYFILLTAANNNNK